MPGIREINNSNKNQGWMIGCCKEEGTKQLIDIMKTMQQWFSLEQNGCDIKIYAKDKFFEERTVANKELSNIIKNLKIKDEKLKFDSIDLESKFYFFEYNRNSDIVKNKLQSFDIFIIITFLERLIEFDRNEHNRRLNNVN